MMSEKYQTDGAPGRDPGCAMNRRSFELPGGYAGKNMDAAGEKRGSDPGQRPPPITQRQ